MKQRFLRALSLIFSFAASILISVGELEAQASSGCTRAADNPIGLYEDCKDLSWGIGNSNLRQENRYEQFFGGHNTLVLYLRTNPELQSQQETAEMFANVRRFGIEKFADEYRAVQGLRADEPARTFLFFEPDRTVTFPVLSIYVGEHWDTISRKDVVMNGDDRLQHQVGQELREVIRTWRTKERIDYIARQLPEKFFSLEEIPALSLTPSSRCTNDETQAFGHVKQCKHANVMMGDAQLFENDRYRDVFGERDFVVIYLRSETSSPLASVLAATIDLDPVVRSEQKVSDDSYSRIIVFHQISGAFTEPDLSVYLGGHWDSISQEKISLQEKDAYAVTRTAVYSIFKDRMVARLRSQIEEDKKALEGVRDEIEDLSREQEASKQELARIEEQKAQLQSELYEVRVARDAVQQNLTRLQNELEIIIAEFERVERKISMLRDSIEKAEERARLKEELKSLMAQREQIAEDKRRLQLERQTAERELSNLYSQSTRLSHQLCQQGRTSYCQ